MKLLKWTWRLLKLTKTWILITLLLASLTLNMALFTGGLIYNVASAAFESMTGLRSVASQHTMKVEKLRNNLDLKRKANRKLRGEVADISENLVNEKKTSRKVKAKLADTSKDLLATRQLAKGLQSKVNVANGRTDIHKRKITDLRRAVDSTSDRVSRRAARTATREVGSMVGKSIPFIGIAVTVGATVWEIDDLCATIKDMNALKRTFNPSLEPSAEQITVCSMAVPTREVLLANVKTSPQKAWKAAKEHIPTIGEIRNYHYPDVDWKGRWGEIRCVLEGYMGQNERKCQ